MMRVKAYAKINLYLDVLKKRSDGYHEVKTVIQEIDLADELVIKNRKSGIKISCSDKGVPVDRTNTVYKAVEILLEHIAHKSIKTKKLKLYKGIEIRINKHIPVAAGLGGGSSDAASALVALNKLWALRLSLRTLESLASKVGSDVPFFIKGGTAYCWGRGEKVKKLPSSGIFNIVLVNPAHGVSTKWVYENLKLRLTNNININIINKYARINRIKRQKSLRTSKLEQFLYNALEPTVIKRYPSIGEIKTLLASVGIKGILMSGSGATVFGILPTPKFAKKVKEVFGGRKSWIWVGKTRCG
ncbi:MAG: 4-(cytidine 5'-diphospho)-2-C-methyl-D-erythritol kinase [bacterium]